LASDKEKTTKGIGRRKSGRKKSEKNLFEAPSSEKKKDQPVIRSSGKEGQREKRGKSVSTGQRRNRCHG